MYRIPTGWEWKKLPDVVLIGCERGFNPSVIDGKVPFIGMSDIDDKHGRNTQYILEPFEKVSNGKTKFQKNAVLVGKITPCTQNNKVSIVPDDIEGGFATTEVFALHCLDKILPLFLNYYVRSDAINKLLVNSMMGATGRQRVPTETLKNLDIPLPPLEEQRWIVGVLDGLFAKIDTSIALLDESIASASALMPSALNEVFEELGEKWEKKKLKDITTKIGSGATPSGGDKAYKESGISLIRSMNVHDNEFRSKNLAFIDDEQARKLNNVSVQENDVLLNITGASVARCCIVDNQYLPARVNQHVSIIRLKNDILPQFIQYYLVNPNTKNELLFNAGGGATREAITKKMIEDFEISLPPLNIQTQIVAYLDTLHVKAQSLKKMQQTKKEELLALKASLLESAFKGEL